MSPRVAGRSPAVAASAHAGPPARTVTAAEVAFPA
ncbi:hypothetical protein Ae263Ps1_5749 [Pseudonocardia sp. Ae263_Ps1]|nr:hypothetical protein Ae150APs1_5576c [Pseudonocardia sp. Ae150A_Ps1]OLL88694.1 hypothetical protein Ae263Ps1_5749 [Pseudonocardia sp. Ae263_Ps1]OLL91285.1 hypothetical protein Ae356Ps1_1182c [Pseudonocardia sp. Ae356_Ps1]